jgi:hypothetical protein
MPETHRPDRALIFPGLVPLTESSLAAIVAVDDDHLRIAAAASSFTPATVPAEYGANPPSTVHEALLAVAVLRRLESGGADQRWRAFGGLSAGCLPALFAAGAISEKTTFELIYEINARQIEMKRTGRAGGVTLAVLSSSNGDALRLVELLDGQGYDAWLSVDLGDGLVAISLRTGDAGPVRNLLGKLGVMVLDDADRPEHCPYAVPDRAAMTAIVAAADIVAPRVPVVSPLTGAVLANTPDALRAMLVDQWFDTASLPRLVDGLCGIPGIAGVDLICPAESVYVTRAEKLLSGRAAHELLPLAG